MNDSYIVFLGTAMTFIGGGLLLLMVFAGLCILINRVSWMIVDACGGIETLREFQYWYHNHRGKK